MDKISFWLIPLGEDRVILQDAINALAQEYDAPSFTPHVTIYSGDYAVDESIIEIIDKATHSVPSFSLQVDQLLYANEFTKTLFVQFHQNPTLTELTETIRSLSKHVSNFSLNPHLSLIYQYLSEEIKQKLINSIKLAKSEFIFDEVQAVLTPVKVQQREDVEKWKVVYTKKL